MVGRAFITKVHLRRQRLMHHEMLLIGKHRLQQAAVVGCSMERWNLLFRLAGVKCTRLSAVSPDGLTVAALAVHMQEADEAAARMAGASLAARATTSPSVPENPGGAGWPHPGARAGPARPA
jgi:hypothetical protein